jgi:putative glycosyltransferase (TIGR04372 family)
MNSRVLKPGELRLGPFVRLQWDRLRKEGATVLLRQASKGFKFLAALPFVLLMRLIRPFFTIRIVQLRFERIGHMAAEPELFLSRRDVGMVEPSDVEIFYPFSFYQAPIANRQLHAMWHRTLRVMPSAKWIDVVNRLIPGGGRHWYDFGQPREWDLHGVFGRTKPHVSFTREEILQGVDRLQELGVPPTRPFVCFISRDPSYLISHQPGEADYNLRWDFRDSDIDGYAQAVQRLAERGYYALRMGAAVAKPFSLKHPMVIDYATAGRSDFMDIFLVSRCAFYLGDTAGLFAVAALFRRPMAWVNLIPLEHVSAWGPRDLFIPKKVYCKNRRRYLTFTEMFDLGVAAGYSNDDYERHEVEIHNNTPQEIESLAIEMDARLKGTWKTCKEDEELQRRFWSIFTSRDSLKRVAVSRIGTEFLRANRELLE